EILKCRTFFDRISVSFKDPAFFCNAFKKRISALGCKRMYTELSLFMRRDGRTHVLSPHLESETHAECGNTKVEDSVVERRRFIEHRCRAARKNNACRANLSDIFYSN